jgi:hypothetical protein
LLEQDCAAENKDRRNKIARARLPEQDGWDKFLTEHVGSALRTFPAAAVVKLSTVAPCQAKPPGVLDSGVMLMVIRGGW